jgi:bilirubin oxidase
VVWLNTNEEVNVIARYAPWDGLYMVSPTEIHARMIPRATTVYHIDGILGNSANSIQFHCHNLIHEDHEMMAAMNVTALADLGYDEKTTFIDPMEQRYRAKGFAGDDFDKRAGDFSSAAIEAKVKFFNDLDAYRNVIAVESRLEDYWQTASSGSASSSTSSSSATPSALAAPSGTTPLLLRAPARHLVPLHPLPASAPAPSPLPLPQAHPLPL